MIADSDITLRNFEAVVGSDHDDVIAMTGGRSLIYGRAGNDTITGTSFSDVIEGGAGSDLLTTGEGADRIIIDTAGTHTVSYEDEHGQTQQYEAQDNDILIDADVLDRLYIRAAGIDGGPERLIPVLGGVATYVGWAPESARHSTFENDPNFSAMLATTWSENPFGPNQPIGNLGGGLAADFTAFYQRRGANLDIDILYNNTAYSIVVQNYEQGDLGLSFTNGYNYMFTDGVNSWRDEGLATMRSMVSTALASGAFSTAPDPQSFLG